MYPSGVFLSFFFKWLLRKIRSYYTFAARAPQLVEKLERHSSNIANYLNDFDAFLPQIQKELAGAEVALNSLKGKLSRQSRQSVILVLKKIRAYEKSKNRDGLYDIYVGMLKIEQEIKEIQEDLKWGR